MRTILSSLVLAAVTSTASASPLSSLTNYTDYQLNRTGEASGVTYNRDTGTFFVVGDEGGSVDQYTRTGQYIDSMLLQSDVSPRELRAVDDAEGITYMGNNRFMIADERDMMGRITTYEAGAERTLTDLTPTSYSFGPVAGNTGLEGVAYDPTNGSTWGIKEYGPVSIYQMAANGTVTEPISIRNITRLGLTQLSDIYVMASCDAFSLDDPRRLNLLLLSRNDNKIYEITRDGSLVDSLDISFLGRTTIEGLTMDNFGNVCLVSEGTGTSTDPSQQTSKLHVLSTVPEPSTYALIGLGLLALWGFRSRTKASA